MHRFMQWREVLQLAPNVKAVKAIMRDYIDSLRSIVGTLPIACQKAMLAEDLDVQAAAVTLLHDTSWKTSRVTSSADSGDPVMRAASVKTTRCARE